MIKNYKLYIVFILMLGYAAFAKAQNSYAVEDTVYQCLIKGMTKQNINFDPLIDTVHKEFVENKVLGDYTGASMLVAIEQLTVEDAIIEYRGNLKNIKEFNIAQQTSLRECIISTDTTMIVDTAQKLMKLVNGLSTITHFKGPQAIAELLLQHLTAKDFEHPLYKMFALALITNRVVDYRVYKETNKFDKERQPKTGGFFKVNIILTDSDKIFYKGSEIEVVELEMFVVALLSDMNNKVKVIVETTERTSPVFYNEVYNTLKDAYTNARNSYSVNTYSVPYDRLDDGQKQKVDKQVVLQIEKAETDN
jgi:hypothetical protein